MTNILLGICVLVIAVECLLIGIEYFKTNQDNKLRAALKAALDKNIQLTQSLALTEKKLESAQAEVQGIYVLWNKSLETEKSMRQELNVAKTQLTYLAQKIVQSEKTPQPNKAAAPSLYWSEAGPEEIPLTSTQLINKHTYQVSRSDLV